MSEEPQTLDVRLVQGAVRGARRHRRGLLAAAAALAVLAVAAGSVYTVPTNQTGALFLLGRLVRDDVAPGIHLKLPAPLQRVRLMNTSEVRRMALAGDSGDPVSLVTADENLIEVDVALQYRVSAYGRFLVGSEDWEQVLRLVVTSVLSEIACKMSVDEVLTTGKSALQIGLRDRAQEMLDSLGSGLTLLSTSIVFIRPPKEAAASFRRVADARSEKAKKVSMAEMAGNRKLSAARGAAEVTLRRADSLAEERIKQARGDVERYGAILRELREAPRVTRTDIYLRQMEKVLGRARLVLFDGSLQRALDLTLFRPGKGAPPLPPGVEPGEPAPLLPRSVVDGEPEGEAPRPRRAEGDGEPEGEAP